MKHFSELLLAEVDALISVICSKLRQANGRGNN